MSRPDPFAPTPIEQELVSERAHALGRSVALLEEALDALRAAEAALSEHPGRAGLVARRDDLFADAAERLWLLVVQREALGLFHHQDLLDALRVPAAVHRRMGPRRRGSA